MLTEKSGRKTWLNCTTMNDSSYSRQGNKGRQRFVIFIFAAISVLMGLFFSYGFDDTIYPPFHVDVNYTIKHTDLKKWSGRDSYVSVQGKESMTMQCQNCALVTSSGHILGSGAGDEIDHTECVIRMNDAPTTGYESDVGSRTTLRVVGYSSVSYVFRNPNEFLRRTDSHSVIIFWGPPYKITKDPKAAFYGSLQRVSMTYRDISYFTVTPTKMLRFDDLFLRETGHDREKSHSWLSTGWFTMVIAIEICDNIKVYGMVPPNHCGTPGIKKVRYHYYNRWWVNECATYFQHENGRSQGQHRFITEKRVFARWAKQYNITFTHPRW